MKKPLYSAYGTTSLARTRCRSRPGRRRGWVALVSLSGPDGSYYLDVAPAEGNASANETIAYETLTTEEREVFESAVASESMVEIPGDVEEDVFIDNRYVQYQNQTYEVMVAVSD